MLRNNRVEAAIIAAGVALTPVCTAVAQGMAPSTQQELADKAAIEDLITRYYTYFGGGIANRVGEFYAEDGEMILGQSSYKGIEAIRRAYEAIPSDAPQRRSFALNILINNLLIKVNGETATARFVFTEVTTESQGDTPKLLLQGREFNHLVKRDGRWLIAKRQIMGPNGVPDDWQD